MRFQIGYHLFFAALFATHLQGAIYGHDDRKELSTFAPNSIERKVARAIALIIPKKRLVPISPSLYRIDFKTLAQEHVAVEEPLCPWEPFQDQTASIFSASTGFLVGQDRMVTAGHVIENKTKCSGAAIVFGYHNDKLVKPEIVRAQDVYYCQDIVETFLEDAPLKDHAVFLLDRPVPNRQPLPIRREGKISDNSTTEMIGHPMGLPIKVTGNGIMANNLSHTYFVSYLDTYGGNSGSPVFDPFTGVVEGVLVEGEAGDTTIKGNWPEGCWHSKVHCPKALPMPSRCDTYDYRGAKVIRATDFAHAVPIP